VQVVVVVAEILAVQARQSGADLRDALVHVERRLLLLTPLRKRRLVLLHHDTHDSEVFFTTSSDTYVHHSAAEVGLNVGVRRLAAQRLENGQLVLAEALQRLLVYLIVLVAATGGAPHDFEPDIFLEPEVNGTHIGVLEVCTRACEEALVGSISSGGPPTEPFATLSSASFLSLFTTLAVTSSIGFLSSGENRMTNSVPSGSSRYSGSSHLFRPCPKQWTLLRFRF